MAWPLVGKVAFWIGLSLIGSLLTPKPRAQSQQAPTPYTLKDFDIPSTEEGAPIGVLFGRRYMNGHIAWYGDLRTTPIIRSTCSGKK